MSAPCRRRCPGQSPRSRPAVERPVGAKGGGRWGALERASRRRCLVERNETVEENVNRIPGRTAVATGVALVAVVGLAALLGSSAAGATAGVNAPARAAAPTDTTARTAKTAAKPWSFGIEADTQWTVADDGKNPNTASIDI